MIHTHGWDVPLVCDQCGREDVPTFGGWAPNWAIRFGKRPTIFAILHCQNCDADLREVAGRRLVELFGATPLASVSKQLLAISAGVAIAVAGLIVLGQVLWGWRAWLWWLLAGLGALVPSLSQWLNNRAMARPARCDCGSPQYKFMGMLGRSCCYRCSSCGRLLRILT